MTDPRSRTKSLAHASLARGDATGWFEQVYEAALGDAKHIPWADLKPNPALTEWIRRGVVRGKDNGALVVGCGLGDDAEALAMAGFDVIAFDVSKTAVDWCKKRFPSSRVDYVVADLLSPPRGWMGIFDFVFEAYTLQSLPPEHRPAALKSIARLVRRTGTVLVSARGRDEVDDVDGPPWPLTRSELNHFGALGLTPVAFDDYMDDESPPVRRFRVEYRAE